MGDVTAPQSHHYVHVGSAPAGLAVTPRLKPFIVPAAVCAPQVTTGTELV